MTEMEVLTTFITELREDILSHERIKERNQKRIDGIKGTSKVLKSDLERKNQLLDRLIIEKTERILALAKVARIVELTLEAELEK